MSNFEDEDMSVDSFTSHADIEEDKNSSSSTELSSTRQARKRANRPRAESTDSASAIDAANVLKNDERVRLLRDVGLMMLLLTATFVSSAVYLSLRSSEQRAFEAKFADQSSHVGLALNAQLGVKLRAIDTMSVTITSYTGSQGNGSSWPHVTLPDFDYRSASAMRNGGGISIGLHPLVYRENRQEWEAFSSQAQGWRRQGLEFQRIYENSLESSGLHDDDDEANHDHRQLHSGELDVQNVSEHIFQVGVNGFPEILEETADVMLPLWQHSPVHDGLPWVNYDVLREKNERSRDALKDVISNKVTLLGQFFDLADSFHG